jgi:hypothetical protein
MSATPATPANEVQLSLAIFEDLPEWPPKFVEGAAPPGLMPESTEAVCIERFLTIREGVVVFTCTYDRRSIPYSYFIGDSGTAEKFAKILSENCGKSLFAIGLLAIPAGLEGSSQLEATA